ncbi:InlB B-repeat-containing protein [Streptococcus moroccensis]|nr:InlB B-repeat-containing protein [Streptococcus moroccensis]
MSKTEDIGLSIESNDTSPPVTSDFGGDDSTEIETSDSTSAFGQTSDENSERVIADDNERDLSLNNLDQNTIIESDDDKTEDNLYLEDTLEYKNQEYIVTVEVKRDAELPKDTVLEVERLNESDKIFGKYKEKTLEKIEKKEEDIKSLDLYDITLYSKEELVQPKAPVKVEITYREQEKENNASPDDTEVVHFKDDGNIEVLKSKDDPETKDSGSDLAFITTSFSIYAIVKKDSEKVFRHTYKFENVDGSQYTFKLNSGSNTDTQIIKDGESLHGIGTPRIASGENFNGWFEYDKETDTYGKEVKFDAPILVTEDKTIYVRPNLGKVFYATFYDDVEGEKILEKIQVPNANGVGKVDLTSISALSPISTQSFAGWSLTKGGPVISQDKDAYPITGDISFYPIFKDSFRLEFNTGDIDDGAPYIPSRMVFKGESAQSVKPEDPKRAGYRFGGWFLAENGQGGTFNFSTPFTKDTVIYAHWIQDKADYTVIYWQQSKSDNKNASAATKTYDYAGQESRTGNVGQTVYLTSSDRTPKEVGFEYTDLRGQTSTVVKADGSSVINVYFNRKLMTMRFYLPAVSSNIPHYYTSYWMSANTRVYTGLYGTSLEENGYDWPFHEGYMWHYPATTGYPGMSYLGEFVFPSNTYDRTGREIRLFRKANYYASGINFYKQNIDGTYSDTPSDIGTGTGGRFTFSEKYAGFTVSQYRRWDGNWYYAASGQRIEPSTGLEIRYERQKYNINIVDPLNDGVVSTLPDVLYEDNIVNHKPASAPRPSMPGYEWDGKWYKDKQLTEEYNWDAKMPAHDIKVYAGYRKAKYDITIDPNGGVLLQGQPSHLKLEYGEKIKEYFDVKRDYVADSEGDYYYRYDTKDNDPNKERRAFYTQNPNEINTDPNTKYRFEKDAYSLIGWYLVNPDGTTRLYNFNGVVAGDTTLRAIWRRLGDFKLKYSDIVYDYNSKKPLVGEDGGQIQAFDVTQDPNKYDDQSHAILPHRPYVEKSEKYRFRGWYYNGKIYNPYDEITVEAKLANEDKEIIIYPVFKEVDDLLVEVTKLIYDGNGGSRQENGQEASRVEITKIDGKDILVNQSTLTADKDYFTRVGYDLIGWNDSKEEADKGNIKFTFKQEIGIDNLEDKANTLYAVWKPKLYTIKVTKKVIGNESDKDRSFTFSPGGALPAQNFFLKDGESKIIKDVPYNSVITIDEQAYEGFTVKETISHLNEDDEVIKSYEATNAAQAVVDGDMEIIFTNERNQQELLIQKVDVANMDKGLTGAVFTLYPLDANGSRQEEGKISDLTSNEEGYLPQQMLKLGTYELVEVKAPDGYQLEQKPIRIAVTSTSISVIQNDNAREVTLNQDDGVYSAKITNSSGIELPNTGGVGRFTVYLIGLSLILPAGLALYYKNKKAY